jgi:hypothetical protein
VVLAVSLKVTETMLGVDEAARELVVELAPVATEVVVAEVDPV